MDFLKKIKKTDMALVICLLALSLYALFGTWGGEEKIRGQKEKIEALNIENDSLKWQNDGLDKKLQALERETDSLEALLKEGQYDIEHLKQGNVEALTVIDGLDGHGLYLFFARLKAVRPPGK